MSQRFRCNACNGEYSDATPDGGIYAHACGPLPADTKNPARERPDKRDENIAVDQNSRVLGIRSEGAGVTCLTDKKIDEPRWISAVKRRVEKEAEKDDA